MNKFIKFNASIKINALAWKDKKDTKTHPPLNITTVVTYLVSVLHQIWETEVIDNISGAHQNPRPIFS